MTQLPYRNTCDQIGHMFPQELKTTDGGWVCVRCGQQRDAQGRDVTPS